MAIIGGDQGKAGESKGSGRKADDLRLSCLCLLLIFYILKAAMQINNLNALIKTKCMELHDFSFSGPFGRFATVIGDFFQEGKGVVLIYEKWERLMPYLDVNSQHLFFAFFFFKI